MSSDYGYINARIRAMRSFLLKEEDYQTALRQRSLDEFISFLSSLASYANDFRQVLTFQSARIVCDEALKLNFCRIFRKIINFCEGEPKELILILLAPWDIYNLKTIIRSKISYQDRLEITQALIPIGKWDLKFLNQLVEVPDLKALANNLEIFAEGKLERALAKVIRDYSQDKPLELLENSLQEAYFSWALDYLIPRNGNARMVLDYLCLKIDFLNMLSVLRLVAYQQTSINIIKGGFLQEAFLKNTISLKNVEDTLKYFQNSPYPWLTSEGLDLYTRTKRISSLERLLKKKLFSFCYNLYISKDPLSIGIPLAFINFKENEINNLRFIGKAIHFGMPEDLVKQELIFAG